jgi:hypothetical protein
MTTVATRTREIGDIEDFDIQVIGSDGNAVDPKTNGFPKFNFDRKSKGDMTVAEWKLNRFTKTYKGYDAAVLKSDGSIANGNVKLSTVRKSYEDGTEPAAKKIVAKKAK